jgi:hypothetical protein
MSARKSGAVTDRIADAAHAKKHGSGGPSQASGSQPFLLSETGEEGPERFFNSSESVNTWIDLLGALPDPESVIQESVLVRVQNSQILALFYVAFQQRKKT